MVDSGAPSASTICRNSTGAIYQMEVPFFNYRGLYEEHQHEFLEALGSTCERGAFIMQRDLQEFESRLAAYLGCRYVIGVADGTAALVFALEVAGVGVGDEVIVSSHTFVATAAAVKHVGAIPVICDCLPDSTMCPDSARKMISRKTKALMPTQLNGRTADMTKLCALADEFNLEIVEDSCQALGAEYDGIKAGLFGKVGSYSFYPSKTLGCFGDGGAVATNDEGARDLILQLRDHGRGSDGKVTRWGHNGRLDNLQAAILNIKLNYYPSAIARRREIASIYHEALSGVDGVLLPPAPSQSGKYFDIFQNYEIRAERRDDLKAYLADRGVGTIIQWGGWMLHQFDDLQLKSDAPMCEELSRKFLMLPMNHLLSNDEVIYVCNKIAEFYEENA